MTRIEILDEAGEELDAVAAKLEAERPGNARIFLEAYQTKLRQIAAFPESGPLVENAPPEFEVRSFLIRKFQHEIPGGRFPPCAGASAASCASRDRRTR